MLKYKVILGILRIKFGIYIEIYYEWNVYASVEELK